MRSSNSASLPIVQINDTHAYFDVHQELFWQGDHAVYRQFGGYARIATIVKKNGLKVQEIVSFVSGSKDKPHGLKMNS